MARSKAATKRAKAAYSRSYRASSAGAKKVLAYNRKTSDERSSRNKARRKVASRLGKSAIKGKDIHHVSSNPLNNSGKNLRVVKAHHEGGTGRPNRNAAKRKRR